MWWYTTNRGSGLGLGSLIKCSKRRRFQFPSPHVLRTATLAASLSWAPARGFSAGPLHYPEAPSKDQHNDVASYVAYAERTGLDVKSNVFVGTHYEYTVAAALRPLGFDLRRVGGQSDNGIDLLGTWTVPSVSALTPVSTHHHHHQPRPPLRVLLQCKAYTSMRSSKIGPRYIRELEGAYLGAPPGWRGSGVLGLLVTQRPATRGVREALSRSRWPLVYASCSKGGALEQMLWNARAEDEGLQGMGVTAVLSRDDRHGSPQRLVLTWNGRPYSPVHPTAEAGTEEATPAQEGATT
ncbi:hypothetical protein F5Y17DRAFT_118433 [Xylariaceae sp. FL0594]|nr:hypothetical protein F5Y17DRAFT_118433 [Xylariaceae sp. FL0594]